MIKVDQYILIRELHAVAFSTRYCQKTTRDRKAIVSFCGHYILHTEYSKTHCTRGRRTFVYQVTPYRKTVPGQNQDKYRSHP